MSQASIIGRGGWRLDGCFVLLHLSGGENLKDNFLDALDRFSPSLMDLFRKKKGVTGQFLSELLRQTKTTSQQTSDAFVFGDCQSSWGMSLLPSSRPAPMRLIRRCTIKLHWESSVSEKILLHM
ncbi:hypothetical protein F7725_007748, partial [Dissostichus mawsoni]